MKSFFRNRITQIFLTSAASILVVVGVVFVLGNRDFEKTTISNALTEFQLPLNYQDPLVIASLNETLSIKPVGARTVDGVFDREDIITYIDAYQNTDVVQTVYSNKIKEDIVLKKPGHPESFAYEINTEDFLWEIAPSGDLLFRDKRPRDLSQFPTDDGSVLHPHIAEQFLDKNEIVFEIPAPFLIDANGVQSGIDMVETKLEDGKLVLTPDKNWLAEHEYPIILDPTIDVPPKAKEEVSSKRSEKGITFRNDDGSYTYKSHMGTVLHYEDAAGQMKLIDTSLEASLDPEFDFVNTTNFFTSYYNSDSSKEFNVKFQKDDYWIKFGLLAAPDLGTRQAVSGEIEQKLFNKTIFTYPAVYGSADVRWILSPEEVREEYVLHEYQDVDSVSQLMEFSENVYFEESENGALLFKHARTGEIVFVLPRPVMYEVHPRDREYPRKDGTGTFVSVSQYENYGLHYELEQVAGHTYVLTKVLEESGKQWLSAPERVFPVVIDDTWGPTSVAAESGSDQGLDDGEDQGSAIACCSALGYLEGGFNNGNGYVWFGSASETEYPGFSWQLPAIAANATVDSMYIRIATVADNTGSPITELNVEDVDPASQAIFTDSNRVDTSASTYAASIGAVSYSNNTYYFGSGDSNETNIGQGLTDLITDYGAIAANDRINIWWEQTTLNASAYASYDDADNGGNLAQLEINWTEDNPVADDWWDNDWTRRRRIDFDNSSQSTGHDNFPAMVALSEATGVNNIDYSQTQNSGQDIRFVDSDNSTQLNYEIEEWDETATSTVWVEVPHITAASSTDHIWMYYGNTGASDAATTTGVWDDNFILVQHLQEATSTASNAYVDSGNEGNHGTLTDSDSSSGLWSGKVDGGFDGSSDVDDYMDFSGIAGEFDGNELTISFWINRPFADTTGTNHTFYQFETDGSNRITIRYTASSDEWSFSHSGGGTSTSATYSASTIPQNTWTYVTMVVSDSGDYKRDYVDGVQQGSDGTGIGTYTGTTDVYRLMSNHLASSGAETYVDEFRVSDTPRSSDWIAFEYCNMNFTCQTYQSEEMSGGNSPTISSISDTPDPTNPDRSTSFYIDWNDADAGETVKVKVCKTDALGVDQVCDGGVWASSTAFTTVDPIRLMYDVVSGDVAGSPNSYYVFVCDDDANCSASSSGTFSVNAVSTQNNIEIRGGVDVR